MRIEATKKLFTVDDYYKMADAGILSEHDRMELIEGEIIVISPMGPHHAAIVARVNHLLLALFREKAHLRPQLPLRLNDFNEPQPDIVLLKPRRDFYSSKHPGPADVFLVMEISDSSLKYDRDVKLPVYAAARVPEVWIADLPNDTLLVYRDPSGKGYKTFLSFGRGDELSCLKFPDVKLAVNDILG
jgi:Uma2 family endonuclease